MRCPGVTHALRGTRGDHITGVKREGLADQRNDGRDGKDHVPRIAVLHLGPINTRPYLEAIAQVPNFVAADQADQADR